MEKETYLKELEKEIKRCTLGEKYAKLCVSYAKGLLDSGLPVIFDIDTKTGLAADVQRFTVR